MNSLKLSKRVIGIALSVLFVNAALADATSDARIQAYKANKLIPENVVLPTSTGAADSDEVVLFNKGALSWSSTSALSASYAPLLEKYGDMTVDELRAAMGPAGTFDEMLWEWVEEGWLSHVTPEQQEIREYLSLIANNKLQSDKLTSSEALSYLTPNIVSFKTVTEAALEFAEVKRLEGRRANLITQYEQVLSGLIKHIGKKTPKLSDCNQTTIEAYLKTKKIGGKKHAYVMLKSFFRWCISRKYMQLSPIDDVVLPKKVQKDNYNASVLHPLALNILLELTRPNLDIHITYLLLSMTGLRPQELLPTTKDTKDTLRWNDIQPQTKAIRIRRDISKTHSASTIIGTPQRLWGTLCGIPMQKYQSSDRIGINYYYYKKLTRHLNALLSLAYDLFIKKGGVLLPTQSFLITRDILRHSFASYAIHTIGIPATALITRHSLQIMQSHYLGVATKEHADLYFNGCDVSDYIEYIRNKMDISIPPYSEYKRQSHPIMKRLISRK